MDDLILNNQKSFLDDQKKNTNYNIFWIDVFQFFLTIQKNRLFHKQIEELNLQNIHLESVVEEQSEKILKQDKEIQRLNELRTMDKKGFETEMEMRKSKSTSGIFDLSSSEEKNPSNDKILSTNKGKDNKSMLMAISKLQMLNKNKDTKNVKTEVTRLQEELSKIIFFFFF